MRFDAVINLITVTYAGDSIGRQVATPVSRQVYANEFTLSASEFYDAGRNGLKPECVYQVRSCDYAGETLMSVGDVEYAIIRPAKKGEWTTLTCERKVGNVPPAEEVS